MMTSKVEPTKRGERDGRENHAFTVPNWVSIR
jgi:hypothetical protein